MKTLLIAVLVIALVGIAESEITRKFTFKGTVTTTWASKTQAGTSKTIRGYLLQNNGQSAIDTIFVGHAYGGSIDTASIYRTPVLAGDGFALSGCDLSALWVRSSAGSIPYILVTYHQ